MKSSFNYSTCGTQLWGTILVILVQIPLTYVRTFDRFHFIHNFRVQYTCKRLKENKLTIDGCRRLRALRSIQMNRN